MEGRRLLVGSILAVVAAVALLALCPSESWAQASAQAQELREMRHFWHVFIAYAIAWILVFGWVVSIVRRLRRVEDTLK